MAGKKDPELEGLLEMLNSGKAPSSEAGQSTLRRYAREAQMVTARINTGYHDQEELRQLVSELTGKDVPEDFCLFPPIYSDFGKNITIGKGVFINSGCCFQDQGGIVIGDGTFIGHNTVLATLDHDIDPEKRHILHPAPIRIGSRVWIGANVVITKGVTIGDNSIIAAGAVVTHDIPANVMAAGVPAKVLREL